MIALGFGVLWVGYAVGMTGYCWVRGYNLSFKEIVSPVGFYTGAKWPPGLVNDSTVLIPTGSQTSGGSTAGQSAPGPGGAAGRAPFVPPVPGKCPAGFTWNKQLQACVPKAGIEH